MSCIARSHRLGKVDSEARRSEVAPRGMAPALSRTSAVESRGFSEEEEGKNCTVRLAQPLGWFTAPFDVKRGQLTVSAKAVQLRQTIFCVTRPNRLEFLLKLGLPM